MEYKYHDVWRIKGGKWTRVERCDIQEFVKQHGVRGVFHSIQAFASPTSREGESHLVPLYFDFDGELKRCFAETRKTYYYLKGLGFRDRDIHIKFSGAKGFHTAASPYVFRGVPSPGLTQYVGAAALLIQNILGLRCLDMSVYSKRRMMRITGSVHEKSGMSAVNISPASLTTLTLEEVLEQAKNTTSVMPDHFVHFEDDGYRIDPAWWSCVVEAQNASEEDSKPYDTVRVSNGWNDLPDCVLDLLEGGLKKKGTRNHATFALALYMKHAGFGEEEAKEKLLEWALALPKEMSGSSEAEKKTNTDSTVTSAYQNDRFFSCGLIRQLEGVACAGEQCAHTSKRPEPTDLVSLDEAIQAANMGRELEFEGSVVMKDSAPYLVPQLVDMKCNPSAKEGSHCQYCKNKDLGEAHLEVEKFPQLISDLISAPKNQHNPILRPYLDVPKQCKRHTIKVRLHMNMLRAGIQPIISPGSDGTPLMDHRENQALVKAHDLSLQGGYRFRGSTVVEPKSNLAIHVCSEATPVKKGFADFRMTPEIHERLKVFQTDDPYNKLFEIHEEYAHTVHHIYGRTLHSIMLSLVFHAATSYFFRGEFQQRGWLECTGFGKTGQGKSKIVKGLIGHYGYGTFTDCAEATGPGLLLGCDKMGGRFVVRLGEIPRNDRGLCVLDEYGRLDPKVAREMCQSRSTGVVCLRKIVMSDANARTAKIFLSNPTDRHGNWVDMESKTYPIEHIIDIMKSPEDTRRCDYVVGFAFSDAVDKLATRPHDYNLTPIYTPDLASACVYWVSSRTPDQIVFADGAEKACYDFARKLSRELTDTIPLFLSTDGYTKLARMGVSIAASTFSCDETGERVVVLPKHIETAERLLYDVYNSADTMFTTYSKTASIQPVCSEEKIRRIRSELNTTQCWFDIVSFTLDNRSVTTPDLEMISSAEPAHRMIVLRMLAKHALVRGSAHKGYIPTRLGLHVMSRLIADSTTHVGDGLAERAKVLFDGGEMPNF